ncbi:MAG: hypothetical protein ABIA93_04115, partial [Candidatus Woesearchaeota archaeon]
MKRILIIGLLLLILQSYAVQAACDVEAMLISCPSCTKTAGETTTMYCGWNVTIPLFSVCKSKPIVYKANESGSYEQIAASDNYQLDCTGGNCVPSIEPNSITAATITCEDPGTYNLKCTFGTTNESTTTTLSCNSEGTSPTTNLKLPGSGATITTSSYTFECNATDNIATKNVSLYTNTTGTWTKKYDSNVGTGAPTAGLTLSYELTGLLDGIYVYNCLSRDYSGNTDWATNFSFTVSKAGWDNENCGTNPGLTNKTTIRSCGVDIVGDN